LVPRVEAEEISTRRVTRIVAVRSSRGARLRTVRVVGGQGRVDPGGVLELRKHVLHVEYDPEVGVADDGDDNDESDEEF